MLTLLMAAASCSGADVVHILEKMRAELESFTVEVKGVRRTEHPRRYESMQIVFALKGKGFTRTQAERAVQLSVGKYCSVMQSLAPDVEITHEITIA